METLYLSGRMSGLPDLNKPAFNDMARRLRRCGYMVINPAELDANEACTTWEECLKRDIRALTRCDAIATLPSWQKSRGASLEVHIGKQLSYPVHAATYYLKKAKRRRIHHV